MINALRENIPKKFHFKSFSALLKDCHEQINLEIFEKGRILHGPTTFVTFGN